MITEQNREAVEVLLSNRTFLYALFHKVFGREPDAELLNILTSDATVESFSLLSETDGDIMSRAAKFLEEVKADQADPAFVGEVKDEYTRLFIGPTKLVAPPWESVYCGKEGMLFQESTLEVREFYKSFGFLPQGYPRVADDSLALELDFMSRLAAKALEALQTGEEAALKRYVAGADLFLTAHLIVWIPKFMEKMTESPSNVLYPQLCLILEDFLKKDQPVLKEILSVL